MKSNLLKFLRFFREKYADLSRLYIYNYCTEIQKGLRITDFKLIRLEYIFSAVLKVLSAI